MTSTFYFCRSQALHSTTSSLIRLHPFTIIIINLNCEKHNAFPKLLNDRLIQAKVDWKFVFSKSHCVCMIQLEYSSKYLIHSLLCAFSDTRWKANRKSVICCKRCRRFWSAVSNPSELSRCAWFLKLLASDSVKSVNRNALWESNSVKKGSDYGWIN